LAGGAGQAPDALAYGLDGRLCGDVRGQRGRSACCAAIRVDGSNKAFGLVVCAFDVAQGLFKRLLSSAADRLAGPDTNKSALWSNRRRVQADTRRPGGLPTLLTAVCQPRVDARDPAVLRDVRHTTPSKLAEPALMVLPVHARGLSELAADRARKPRWRSSRVLSTAARYALPPGDALPRLTLLFCWLCS